MELGRVLSHRQEVTPEGDLGEIPEAVPSFVAPILPSGFIRQPWLAFSPWGTTQLLGMIALMTWGPPIGAASVGVLTSRASISRQAACTTTPLRHVPR